MKMSQLRGFTIVELMIAMVISLFLVLAVSLSYTSIKRVTQTTSELESVQEVLRYTSQIFIRSMKQTQEDPVVSPDTLSITIEQQAGSLSCLGTQPVADYTETFTFANDRLRCDIGGGAQDLLTGLNGITFAYNNADRMLGVTVFPIGMPFNYGAGITINIAASTIWLNDYFG